MTDAATVHSRPALGVCQLCCRPVDRAELRCPAFTRAGIPAHAGCCGGCGDGPARPGLERSVAAMGMADG
jgi:hypothetical protein